MVPPKTSICCEKQNRLQAGTFLAKNGNPTVAQNNTIHGWWVGSALKHKKQTAKLALIALDGKEPEFCVLQFLAQVAWNKKDEPFEALNLASVQLRYGQKQIRWGRLKRMQRLVLSPSPICELLEGSIPASSRPTNRDRMEFSYRQQDNDLALA